MFNTPENIAKFVAKFGYQHPTAPYAVDAECAEIVLSRFDDDEQAYRDKSRLWGTIMQNRKTYMLGERHLIVRRSTGKTVTDAFYSQVETIVTNSILEFVDGLETA